MSNPFSQYPTPGGNAFAAQQQAQYPPSFQNGTYGYQAQNPQNPQLLQTQRSLIATPPLYQSSQLQTQQFVQQQAAGDPYGSLDLIAAREFTRPSVGSSYSQQTEGTRGLMATSTEHLPNNPFVSPNIVASNAFAMAPLTTPMSPYGTQSPSSFTGLSSPTTSSLPQQYSQFSQQAQLQFLQQQQQQQQQQLQQAQQAQQLQQAQQQQQQQLAQLQSQQQLAQLQYLQQQNLLTPLQQLQLQQIQLQQRIYQPSVLSQPSTTPQSQAEIPPPPPNVDPAVWRELPPEIRAEIIQDPKAATAFATSATALATSAKTQKIEEQPQLSDRQLARKVALQLASSSGFWDSRMNKVVELVASLRRWYCGMKDNWKDDKTTMKRRIRS